MRLIPVGGGQSASVDDEDFEVVSKYKWYRVSGGRNVYATANIGGRRVLMHRLILKAADGTVIDHIDGSGLNNQKTNLRFCSRAQNLQNSRRRDTPGRTSQYKGVWHEKENCRKCYRAAITAFYNYLHLGSYFTEEEAARAYDAAARRLHGEFARPNFPEQQPPVGSTTT